MTKLEEAVNAIAETVMTHAAGAAADPGSSILAGARIDLEASGGLWGRGFALRLADGSKIEVRLSVVE